MKNGSFAVALRDCLYRVGRVSERVSDLEPMLLAIIQECATLLDCEAASVAIYDAENNDLVFAVALGEAETRVRQFRMRMGEGIVGQVAQEQTPCFTNDPLSNPLWSAKVDEASEFSTRNLAAVPMVRKGLLIGVLEAINCHAQAGFQEQDLELMQLFADQVAITIENHRLIVARQESERLATFAVALADIGHSVKNILTRLEMPIHLIDKGLETQDWKILNAGWSPMKRATRDIGTLVREMLSYSRSEKPSLQSVPVSDLVAEVIEQCRADAESRTILLICNSNDPNLVWTLDPNALRYALHNLIGNAIEAIAEQGGSTITVTVGREENGAVLRLVVTDDGPGIPPEIQKRVFDPFFTTKKSKGTGLGLANVKKGVESQGGRVTLHSAPGHGTSFSLCYPQGKALAR